jgi:hypothetical protein
MLRMWLEARRPPASRSLRAGTGEGAGGNGRFSRVRRAVGRLSVGAECVPVSECREAGFPGRASLAIRAAASGGCRTPAAADLSHKRYLTIRNDVAAMRAERQAGNLSDGDRLSERRPERFAACFEKLQGNGVILTLTTGATPSRTRCHTARTFDGRSFPALARKLHYVGHSKTTVP